jgi:hypothetical protein
MIPGAVRTVKQLTTLWETNPAFCDQVYPEVPECIVDLLEKDAEARQLLQYFGDTLHPEATLEESFVCAGNVPLGAWHLCREALCMLARHPMVPVLFSSSRDPSCMTVRLKPT